MVRLVPVCLCRHGSPPHCARICSRGCGKLIPMKRCYFQITPSDALMESFGLETSRTANQGVEVKYRKHPSGMVPKPNKEANPSRILDHQPWFCIGQLLIQASTNLRSFFHVLGDLIRWRRTRATDSGGESCRPADTKLRDLRCPLL